MGKIPKYNQLTKLTDQELIERYDAHAENTVVGTGYYLDEIVRRNSAKQTAEMLKLTKNIKAMTFVITLLTVLNVILVAYALLK